MYNFIYLFNTCLFIRLFSMVVTFIDACITLSPSKSGELAVSPLPKVNPESGSATGRVKAF